MADLTIGGAVRASGHTVRIRPSVRVFGSARLVWGQFCWAANILIMSNILKIDTIRCTANNP